MASSNSTSAARPRPRTRANRQSSSFTLLSFTHASRITRVPTRGKHNIRRAPRRPPPGVSCAHNRVSHAHDAGVTPRSRSSLTPAPGRARRAKSPPARAPIISLASRRARAYRIDALASVSTHRRSSSSVVAVAAVGRSTRGVFVRVSRASRRRSARAESARIEV